MPNYSLDTLTLAHFHPFMGHTFDALAGDGGRLALVLIRGAEVPRAAAPKAKRTPFCLLFRGPREGLGLAGDGVYSLRHADGWAIEDVLVSPVIAPEEDEPGIYYQCCFN